MMNKQLEISLKVIFLMLSTIFHTESLCKTVGLYCYPDCWRTDLLISIGAQYGLTLKIVNNLDEETLKKCDGVITENVQYNPCNQIPFFNKSHEHQVRLYAIELESPHTDPLLCNRSYTNCHSVLFVLDSKLVALNRNCVKINYPMYASSILYSPQPFNEKKLCCLMSSFKTHSSVSPLKKYDLYKERIDVIEFFNKYNRSCDFDFYGYWWEGTHFASYPSFRGSVEDKLTVLNYYKFNICFENCSGARGYITEKIFDAFYSMVVPVYWGAPDITNYIPKNCFIDMRDFNDYDELYNFLKNMDEVTYNTYLENIKNFFKTPACQAFYIERVYNLILSKIAEDLKGTFIVP